MLVLVVGLLLFNLYSIYSDWVAEYPILAFHNNIVLCSREDQ